LPRSTHFPYATLFRSLGVADAPDRRRLLREALEAPPDADDGLVAQGLDQGLERRDVGVVAGRRRRGRLIVQEQRAGGLLPGVLVDRKSTRLNSSHVKI